jgi:hypothetical protein
MSVKTCESLQAIDSGGRDGGNRSLSDCVFHDMEFQQQISRGCMKMIEYLEQMINE